MTSAIGGASPCVHGQQRSNYEVTSRWTLSKEAIYKGGEAEAEGGGLAGGEVRADGSSKIGPAGELKGVEKRRRLGLMLMEVLEMLEMQWV